MFAPGMPRTTPGTVRVRLTKFRPFSGSVWICSSLTVVPSSDDEVWTSGEAPVTACAASEPGSRLAAMIRPSTALFTFVLHAPASRRDCKSTDATLSWQPVESLAAFQRHDRARRERRERLIAG